MPTKIALTAADGHLLNAWRADPETPSRGGVVILHAIYGLTAHIGDVCERYAERGYTVIAPALYDRVGRDILHPYTAEGVTAGSATYNALTKAQILADVEACAAVLRTLGPVAISGFCTGGTWAWIAAAELRFDAHVNFYGSHVPARLEYVPKCPTIMHYGDADPIVPIEQVEQIRRARPEVTFHIYPGGQHAFFNPEQRSYDATHAALALDRTIAFLDRTFADGERPSR